MIGFLTSIASVQVFTPTLDESGAPSPSWVPHPTLVSLPCSVQPASAEVIAMYGGRSIRVDHEIYFDQAYAISNRDRLVVNGVFYTVEGLRDECLQGRLFVIDAGRVV